MGKSLGSALGFCTRVLVFVDLEFEKRLELTGVVFALLTAVAGDLGVEMVLEVCAQPIVWDLFCEIDGDEPLEIVLGNT